MGLIYYFYDIDPRGKDRGQERMFKNLPSYDTILLLKALYLKKEKFRKTANCIICSDDIGGSAEFPNRVYSGTTMYLKNKSYSCSENNNPDYDIFGCLIKLLKDLPDNTLIETNSNHSYEASYFTELLYREYNVQSDMWLHKTFADIQNLCEEKNIYIDINPYSEIAVHKEPIETWINTKDATNRRYCFTKYEDTYIDGHVDYHEEDELIQIVDKVLISSTSQYITRKTTRVEKTFEVTYEDGVVGQVYETVHEWD